MFESGRLKWVKPEYYNIGFERKGYKSGKFAGPKSTVTCLR